MTPDLATFRILFPEFASVPDATVVVYLDDAVDLLNADTWGLCYAKAALYYAAHELALAQARAASAVDSGSGVVIPATGQLVSGSEEGISFAFAQSTVAKNSNSEWLSQSPYGQAYLALQRQCLGGLGNRLSW